MLRRPAYVCEMRQTEVAMRTERTTLIYWVAAALAIGSSTAMAADNWVKLAPLADNGGSLYLDKDSIEHNKDGTVRAPRTSTAPAGKPSCRAQRARQSCTLSAKNSAPTTALLDGRCRREVDTQRAVRIHVRGAACGGLAVVVQIEAQRPVR